MIFWIKKSLELKIISALALILIILFALFSVVNLSIDSTGTHKLVRLQLEGLANTIQNSLIKDMSEGRSNEVQRILEMVGTEKGIIAVRIFSEDGRILKSNHRQEVGGMTPTEVLNRYRSGSRDFISEKNGLQSLNILHPIANSTSCHGCHDQKTEINGVLDLEYSLEPVQEYIHFHNLKLLFILIITLLTVVAMVFYMFRRLVGLPLAGMKTAMSEAEQGNLDIGLKVDSPDVIGSLQDSFNKMLSRIKELNRENIVQQRDLLRKEQELQVQNMLAEQHNTLESAFREISDKNLYYIEMLSFISHELKSPLVILKGYAELLKTGELGPLQQPQQDAIAAMDRSIGSIGDMIMNYLDLSKIESGEMVLDRKRLQLVEDILKPVLDEFTDTIIKASMSVRVEISDPGMEINADQTLLRSVITNILTNAVKYGQTDSDIVITVEKTTEGVLLSVQNAGQMVPNEKLAAIFDRFIRLEHDGARSRKGSGLGLYIVKRIVELHGGRVWCDSEEGWVRISVVLPEEKAIDA